MNIRPRLIRLACLLPCLALLSSLTAAPVISEFSSAGQGHILDDDSDYPDWLELSNPDAEPYSLTGHFLTDDPNNLAKWEFPRGETLQPGGQLLLFASRKDRTNIFQGVVHTNFALPSRKGFLALVAADGETRLHQWQDYPKQAVGVSYGLDPNGEPGYFAEPTPGRPNGSAVPALVKDTQFSVDRGFYDAPIDLTISSATEGARIYFTLDGDDPGPENGEVFVSPIRIDRTTIVRAIALREGMIPSNVDTHSYLFLSSVLTQPEDPPGFPERWGSVPADYAFDTSVATSQEFSQALLAYPTISLVMPLDSWFNPSRTDGVGGLYANSLERGVEWEKAISAEFINFEGSANTQVECGIRIYGNASRQTSRPKHNMRLAFRARYGHSKLDFPVFGKGKATGINGLLFNGQNGDSWFHPALAQRQAASYIRDHFAHELLGDMGHLTPPQSRAHIYVNGLYWGFYQTVERVDQHFMARLLGGEPEEYDCLKASIQEGPTLVAGNTRAYDKMFDLANAGVGDADGYAAIQQFLNLDSFIDYMLINYWSGNRDWDHNNWRNGRHRSPGSPWHYFMWDSENIFKENNIDRTGNNTADNPTRLHTKLSENPDYRLKFADRVQKHLFNDGLLTEEAVKARWERWATYIRPGLKAESARWGDHHRAGNPHTVEDDYERAYENLMDSLFPARARNALRQFRDRDLYPSDLQPVVFNQHGGTIEAGFTLTMEAGSIFQPQAGDIVYTLDGTDPRESGSVYQSGLVLEESTSVHARVHDPSGRWGPVTATRFTLGQGPQVGELLLSEIHYHPAEPTASENPQGVWSRTDYEFLEVWNRSSRTLQLAGVALTEGVRFTFPEASLAPGERAVVVEDREAFASRYGSLAPVFGPYQGQLSNGGEQLTLANRSGELLHTLFFQDNAPWPAEPDGRGQSLVLSAPENHADGSGWSSSRTVGGSPTKPDAPEEGGDTLPADFRAWLGARAGAAPLDLDPRTRTSHLVSYALGLDLPGTASGGIRVHPPFLSLDLRSTASTWEVIAEGSTDLQTWTEKAIGLVTENTTGSQRRWRLADPQLPYYRFRIVIR